MSKAWARQRLRGSWELRGPDPLENPERQHWIAVLLAECKDRVSINTVLTAENHDLKAIKLWFQERLGLYPLRVWLMSMMPQPSLEHGGWKKLISIP